MREREKSQQKINFPLIFLQQPEVAMKLGFCSPREKGKWKKFQLLLLLLPALALIKMAREGGGKVQTTTTSEQERERAREGWMDDDVMVASGRAWDGWSGSEREGKCGEKYACIQRRLIKNYNWKL
jgi:hypothetical protein